ncbi:MAG: EAL domain-containing protein [Desulfobacterales bacterium]|nr:EAL domain-containing protein [Desulfobacterales bacterium]
MKWCLEALADAGRKWLVTIESVPFVIGRADDCDLNLIDDRISRHHCEIRISSDLLWIRDLESVNGTYVNKNKITQAELLEPNDIISIGKFKFKVKGVLASKSTTAQETIHATLPKKIYNLSYFEPKLQMLLHDRNVIPHFQPIVRFSDMTEVGYEILGRVDDEELPSNPSELLDMAACLELASDLSSLFREVGVEIGKNLPGSPLLFVNITQLEIYEIDALLASLRRIRDIAPLNKIVLEINEKAATDTNEFPQLRDALGKMDMGLAFDDFGVGQTRLVELSNISPDYLKFDISLIRQIHLAPKRLHQMIETFIKASHDLGILTLAEGIECSEEAGVCKQLGFDLGQGFFFGRPVPINAIEINLNFTPGA